MIANVDPHIHIFFIAFFRLFYQNDLEAYSEPCQTYKMERFTKIVKGEKPLTIFEKRSILYVQKGSEYNSEISPPQWCI